MAIRAVAHGLVAAFIAGALMVSGALPAGVAPAAASSGVPGYEYFHSYADTSALLSSEVTAHPDIARKFSIGKSYQGRSIWAIELTTDVAAGAGTKPAVLIDANIHAREHAGTELAIYMIGLLANNYSANTAFGHRVKALLDTRVVYVIPILNPDGSVYDFSGGVLHRWRKNRQPIPGSTAIGVDLNRNFGFEWACCGGSSSNPFSDYYHGPSAWFAPEAVALRNFFASQVIGGKERVTEEISIHSAARLVLWPYGYTTAAIPSTMTADDHKVFATIGQGMGARNGYPAEQSSTLYITDGDAGDWMYGVHRAFHFDLEMAPGSPLRYYPTQAQLNADIARNRPAVMWFLAQGDCPYRVAGLAAQYCQ